MIYSAFDWGSGKYRVFEDSTQVPYMSDPKSCVPMYGSPVETGAVIGVIGSPGAGGGVTAGNGLVCDPAIGLQPPPGKQQN